MLWKRARRRRTRRFVNTSRVRLNRVNKKFARDTGPEMLVLDAGAGRGPYRKLFKHARYDAADFAQLNTSYTELDYVCTLTDIPVEDGRFDRILFNQVLEHVDDPPAVLAELSSSPLLPIGPSTPTIALRSLTSSFSVHPRADRKPPRSASSAPAIATTWTCHA